MLVEMLEQAQLDLRGVLAAARLRGLLAPPRFGGGVNQQTETARIELGGPLVDRAQPQPPVIHKLEEVRALQVGLERRDTDRRDDRARDGRGQWKAQGRRRTARGGRGGPEDGRVVGGEQQRNSAGEFPALHPQKKARRSLRIAHGGAARDHERDACALPHLDHPVTDPVTDPFTDPVTHPVTAQLCTRKNSVEDPRVAGGAAQTRLHAEPSPQVVGEQRIDHRALGYGAVGKARENEMTLVGHTRVEPPHDGDATAEVPVAGRGAVHGAVHGAVRVAASTPASTPGSNRSNLDAGQSAAEARGRVPRRHS